MDIDIEGLAKNFPDPERPWDGPGYQTFLAGTEQMRMELGEAMKTIGEEGLVQVGEACFEGMTKPSTPGAVKVIYLAAIVGMSAVVEHNFAARKLEADICEGKPDAEDE